MTPSEAVIELQNTYDKELTEFQTARYCRFLGKFKLDDIERIVEKAIEETRMLPKIAHLKDAATDLLIIRPDRKRKADPDCPVCYGTGWQYVTVMCKYSHENARTVKPCGCKDDPGI